MTRLSCRSASLACRLTPWDERVFGHRCAEITALEVGDAADLGPLLALFNDWARQEQVAFAYGRFPPTAAIKAAFHEAGFYYAEASYRLRHARIQQTASLDALARPGPVLQPAQPADLARVQDILAEDFHHGRIHEDPWVDPADAAQRNRNWLADLQAQRHDILTYQLKGEVIGLHVQRAAAPGPGIEWVLTGVKRSHALLVVSLWAEVMKWNRAQGVREVHTLISAANVPILNLYRRLDFQFESLLIGFHRRYRHDKNPL